MSGLVLTIRRTAAAGMVVATVAGCAAAHAQATHALRPAAAAHARAHRAARPDGRLPGIYLGAMAGPWHGPSVRPRSLLLGADWSISRLRWTRWSPRRADGQGYYIACQGARGPCDKYRATIAANHVREHDGRLYFATMRITGRHERVQWLVMNTKLGWWQQSGRP